MKKSSKIATAIMSLSSLMIGTYSASAAVTITKVYDGDTITLSTGEKVRFLQIDTPELSPGECYANQARTELVKLLNAPGQLALKADPNLDKVDRYGRILRYVFVGKTNINLKMVELGAAAPYFYRSERGKYSDSILIAAKAAQAKKLGMWKDCPGTKLTPNSAVTTSASAVVGNISMTSQRSSCNLNYKECLPAFPPDLNCSDIKRMGLASIHVIGIDVFKLDRDGDKVGCDR
jgi:endonuclease YncB( thermonuclease family)